MPIRTVNKTIGNLWGKTRDFMSLIKVAVSGDDKGVSFIGGQVSIGSPDNGNELIWGQGDSYPVERAIQYNLSNETGNVITGAVDVTVAFKSDSGSSLPLFNSNAVGEVILVGSSRPWYGAKIKYTENGTMEPDNISSEYLSNIDSWNKAGYMVTNSETYERKSYYLSSFLSEQVRFSDSILNPVSDWGLRTLNINGEDITKYWVRLRLLSPITAIPSVEQIKHHTSRGEGNSDGVVELFGKSRGIRDLITDSRANNLSDPVNENVTYFTGGVNGGSAKILDNEFANNAKDSRTLIVKIDDDIDTSTPLLISYPFYVKGSNTGDIIFEVEHVQITSDFVYDSLVLPDQSETITHSILTPSDRARQVLQFEVPIDRVDPNIGGVAIVLTRDATNILDTLDTNIVLAGDNVRGRRWRI